MTQPLSTRLVNFESRVNIYKDAVLNFCLDKEQPIEKQYSQLRAGLNELNLERRTLKEAVKHIENTVKKPFQAAINHRFAYVNKIFKEINVKFDSSKETIITRRDFDQFYHDSSIKETDVKKMDEFKNRNIELVSSRKLTAAQIERSIEIHNAIENSQKGIITSQLEQLRTLINGSLTTDGKKNQNLLDMQNIFNKQLPSCALGARVQKEISKQINRETNPVSSPFKNWREAPIFNDLNKLYKIINGHPLCKSNKPSIICSDSSKASSLDSPKGSKGEKILDIPPERKYSSSSSSDSSSSEEELKKPERLPSIKNVNEEIKEATVNEEGLEELAFVQIPPLEDPTQPVVKEETQGITSIDMGLGNAMEFTMTPNPSGSETAPPVSEMTDWLDFDPPPLVQVVAQPQENVPEEFNLRSLRSEIVLITLSHELSEKERIAKIDKARYLLPEKDRWDLDGKFYELSTEKNKGGEGWADKNAAKDPNTLLRAINALTQE